MAGQDAAELVIASHGDLYVAPVGTALPTAVTTALNAAFFGVGLISEDGASLSVAPDIQEHRAWQKRQPVRRELVGQNITIAAALEQWNAVTIPLAFGGGTIVESPPGSFRYDFPDGDDALDERALVLDWQDGPNSKYRAVFPKVNVTEAVETQLARGSLALLPLTFAVLAPETGTGSPGYILGDDQAFHS